jgi:phosphohistidine phosphatase
MTYPPSPWMGMWPTTCNVLGHGLDSRSLEIVVADMRRLMLMRHAKSDRSPGTADALRPLNARGVVAARLMGAYMARHGLLPDLVLCSPAQRTRETLAGVAEHWPAGAPAVFEERLYMAPPKVIVSAIRSQNAKVQTLLVIGHNPGLHEAADLLVAAGDVELREQLREKFPTGALAVIDFAVSAWSRAHEHSGRLDRYVTPRAIAAATN